MKREKYRSRILAILTLLILFIFTAALFLYKGKDIYKDVKEDVSAALVSEDKDIFSIAKVGISSVETALNEYFPLKEEFVNIHGLFNRVLGKKVIIDSFSVFKDIYKMDSGQLTYVYPKRDLTLAIDNMKEMKEFCEGLGSELLYVQFPFKLDKYNNTLPHGMSEETNEMIDEFLGEMSDVNIPTVDCREILREMGGNYSDKFYMTDHHWTTQTAFHAYGEFMNYLHENYGYDYDARNVDKKNFNFVTLKDSFIGSQGNRTGLWYVRGGADDFTYAYPAFDTDYVWKKFNGKGKKKLVRKGRFEDSVLFQSVLENPDTAMPYRDSCYFNGNPALTEVTNKKVKDGKIIVIADSFSKPFNSFLSLNFHELVFVDLRDYKKDLYKYIKENDFDFVVVAYSPHAFKGETFWQSFYFRK